MKKHAMERMEQTQKRKSVEGERKRSSRSDTSLYLRERNKFLQETQKEELALRKQELMKLIVQQQQLQSQQIQYFQALMFTVLNKFGPK